MSHFIFLGVVMFISFGQICHAWEKNSNPVRDGASLHWRVLNVETSSNTAVLLSSAPVNAVGTRKFSETPNISATSAVGNLGISYYGYRKITNNTNGYLMLFPNPGNYDAFSSTKGIVISSDNVTGGFSKTYEVPHQGPVWGIRQDGTAEGGGATVEECFDDAAFH